MCCAGRGTGSSLAARLSCMVVGTCRIALGLSCGCGRPLVPHRRYRRESPMTASTHSAVGATEWLRGGKSRGARGGRSGSLQAPRHLRGAAAIAQQGEEGLAINAFYASRDGLALSLIELKRFTPENLPAYHMIPDRFSHQERPCRRLRATDRSITSGSKKSNDGFRPQRAVHPAR